jgi:protoporphyrinogen/coproporphyrinogen III oxidase
MEHRDAIVVGGGVSGLAFAYHAAAAGKAALVLEGGERLGGCIDTRRLPAGFWLEMGAHTCYNSYGSFIEIAEGCGLGERIQSRGEARKRFALLGGGKLAIMGPLSVFWKFDPWELLRSAPSWVLAEKQGQTTYGYYSRLVGKRNYDRILGPFLAAVPSQSADAFPATGPGSLFKKRPRRKDVAKSFTLQRGLSTVVEGIAARPGVEARTGATVREVRRAGRGFEVATADGRRFEAPVVALAVPPSESAAVARADFPELAGQLARIRMASLDTVGVVVAREKVAIPEIAFLVPRDDIFFSAVTRDPVADPARRAFAFHFKTGHSRAEKLRRIGEVLGVGEGDLQEVFEKTTVLPSPVLGHGESVREIDRLLEGGRLAVTGNYFAGLAIEDCVLRSRAEWARVAVG